MRDRNAEVIKKNFVRLRKKKVLLFIYIFSKRISCISN